MVATFAIMVGLQWAATHVPEERLAAALDDGAARIEALSPRPHLGTAHRLRHHLQYMECEMAALALRGADRSFFGSRWLQAVFAPSPAGTRADTLLPRCRHFGDGWRIVDHYGWRFDAPKREAIRGTERWRTAVRRAYESCPEEKPQDAYPRPYRWEAPAQCRAARLAETCAAWLHPTECTAYAAAPLAAKPYKPRYWWGTQTLYVLALGAMPADAVRTAAAVAGLSMPALFLLAVARRSRKAALMLGPVALLAWWSQWDYGLWSMETAAPHLWAWSAGTVAALMASRRYATAALLACGMLQAYLWLLDTSEALGFGLVALVAYAIAREDGEHEGLKQCVVLAGAYAAGFALALASGVALRHAVYETTIALAHPELSGYVLTNMVEQVASRSAEGQKFVAADLGIAGIAYFLAWTWSQLTALPIERSLLFHAGCYVAMAAHVTMYVIRVGPRGTRMGPRGMPTGATVAGVLALAGLSAEVVPWNDDWVRLGRATILVPAVASMLFMAYLMPAADRTRDGAGKHGRARG